MQPKKYPSALLVLATMVLLLWQFSFGPNALAATNIVLQDGLNGYAGTTDTDLNTYSKTTNTGTAESLRIRAYGNLKSLIRFDLSSIPANATINSATLSVYVASNNGNGGGNTLLLNRVLKDWQEPQATWNVFSTSNNWTTAGLGSGTDYDAMAISLNVGYSPTNVWANFPVTAMVQDWMSGTNPNLGVVVRTTNGPRVNIDSSEYADTAFRPMLVIDYTEPNPDTEVPSIPTNLSATAVSTSQIDLSWTSSTDNIAVAGYKIYRDTSLIATTTLTSYQNTALSASTTYSYTISAYDASENESGQSQFAQATTFAPPPPDTTAPAYTTLSVASCDATSCALSWTAPGDDSNTGTAASYDIRYASFFISEGSWASATQVSGEPVPQIAGTLENFVINNLVASSTYYFAIKTSDEAGNTSIVSNSPQGITPPSSSGDFNVTLQDGLNGYTGITDTYVNTYAKTTNYGTDSTILTGQYGYQKGLIRFDLSSIPANATINSATMSFYAASWGGNAGNNKNAIYRVLDKDWVESEANWNTYSNGNNWTTAGLGSGTDYGSPIFTTVTGYTPPGPMWVNYNVTTILENWVNGSYPNYGIVYLTNGGPKPTLYSTEYSADPSLRPKLVVDYTVLGTPPPPPSPPPPPPPGPFSFNATGDIGASADTTVTLQHMATQGSAFTLALGDLSYSQLTPESAWCNYVKGIFGQNYPFLLEVGNHESPERGGGDGNIDNFTQCLPTWFPIVGNYGREYYFDYPYGTTTIPLARFIMLNANLPENYLNGSEAQARVGSYIDEARAAGIKWIVVGMHMLCPSLGEKKCYGSSGSPGPDLFNFLVDKKVDLILHGHDHNYQRTKQLALSASCPNIPVEDGTPNPVADLDCVVDSDDSLVKGAGTVIVISGRTPNYQYGYSINWSDPEAPYFRSAQGSNYGYTKVTVTETQLTSEFIQTGAVSESTPPFSDTFTITEP